jgi:hypothetical protein
MEAIMDSNVMQTEPRSAADARACYEVVKAASIGAEVCCPVCQSKLIKNRYNTVFCSNSGSDNCKDNYWNLLAERNPLTGYRPKTAYEKAVKQLAKAEALMGAAIKEVGDEVARARLRTLQRLLKEVINDRR